MARKARGSGRLARAVADAVPVPSPKKVHVSGQAPGPKPKADAPEPGGPHKPMARGESPVWQGTQPYRGGTRTNGERGKARRYYEWDHTHGDIEVYDRSGNHLGSIDPSSGVQTKPAVPGRRINV